MILLIDNYDSFTYNLYQYIGIFEPDIRVVRNDKITVREIRSMKPDRIVLSPGPKGPEDAGICMEAVKSLYREVPILGICLGHQCIGAAFGGKVVHAKQILHGRQSVLSHNGEGLFSGIPSPVRIARYHSLAVSRQQLPEELFITAETEDGEIMGIRHRDFPTAGLQFHPESIYTEHGKRMVENFINGRM